MNAEIAGRNSRAYRGRNDDQENAIRQQQFDLNKQVVNEATARMAQQDAVWQEGMSRYQRAINAGDDPAAADLEILAPLRQAGSGTKATNLQPPNDNRVVNLGRGGVGVVNTRTKDFDILNEPTPIPEKAAPAVKLDAATVSKRNLLEDEIKANRRSLNSTTRRSEKVRLQSEIDAAQASLDALLAPTQQPVTAPTATATTPPPMSFMGTPGGQNLIPPREASGSMVPPMPGLSAPQSETEIPPAASREVGRTYNLPKGQFKWTGNGWVKVQ